MTDELTIQQQDLLKRLGAFDAEIAFNADSDTVTFDRDEFFDALEYVVGEWDGYQRITAIIEAKLTDLKRRVAMADLLDFLRQPPPINHAYARSVLHVKVPSSDPEQPVQDEYLEVETVLHGQTARFRLRLEIVK